MTRKTKLFNLFTIKFILLIVLSINSNHATAQKYKVTQYTEADGLGNSTTFDITQDLTHKMWFATRSGISSFDGSNWENFNTKDGLSEKGYAFIEADEKGIIWALPSEGPLYLTAFIGDRWENVFPASKDLSFGLYRSLSVHYENEEPIVCVGTEKQGVIVNRDGKWTHYTESNGLMSNVIMATSFVQDSLFVATDKGINIIYNNRISILDYQKLDFPGNNIIGMCTQNTTDDHKDKCIVWVAGKNWLGYISNQKFILVSSDINITVDNVFSSVFLLPDKNNGIYFCNEFAVMYFDFKTKKLNTFGKNNGLITDGAATGFIDIEENLWIACSRGVDKISSKRFVYFSKENGLFDYEVTSVEEISQDNYVFGHVGALTFYEEGVFNVLEFKVTPDNWTGKRVMDICIDNDRNIWFAAGTLGLGFVDKNKKIKWFSEKAGLHGYMTSVISTRSGKIYASSDKGLYVLSGNKFELLRTEETWSRQIRKIFEAKDGSLYFTTLNKGVYNIKDGIQKNIKYDGRELFNSTYCVCESPEGDILVGSRGGVMKIQDSILVKFKDIPLERPVYLIINDHKGRIWFGSDNGIYRWDGKDFEHFSVNDGLAGHETNRDAGLLDTNNNLWFGSNNGVTLYREIFDYSNSPNIPPPKIILSSVEVDSDTLSIHEKISLDYDNNDLMFNFKGISFIDENQIYYKCKLEGFDEDWTPEFRSLQNSYRYFNLKPGKYRFCVKAKNALGIWSEPLCSNIITIKAPFWFQWWFMTFTTVFILLIVGAIFHFFNQRQYAFKLKETVQIRTKELKEAKEKAEESERLKSAFLANMSHEIRTPMNGILGFTELLSEPNLSGKEKVKYINIITKSGYRMLNTVNDIIDISKIDAGQVQVEKTEVNINDELESLYAFFKPEAESKGLELILKNELHNTELYLETDKGKLISILTNLIKNAIKFTKIGSIEIEFSKVENNFLCDVKDTGIGLQENAKESIFKRFEQADVNDSYSQQGSGLGLAITKSYIEMLGGEISVESEFGKGSTFHFTLPWKSTKKKLIKEEFLSVDEHSKKNDKKYKILIAEDDLASTELLKVILDDIADEMFLVSNGEEAVKQMKNSPTIDLILMDINMPKMNGYEATKQIREFNKDVIIIAQTAYAIAGDREKSIEAGCDDYITKPIIKEVFLQKIFNLKG